jgi:tetratricopeptide (TPR) repeat protein
MGVNSGDVVVGKIGDDLRMDYTAQGHTVGLAQRMEQRAEPGCAYLTEHTAQLVEGFFQLRDLGEFDLEGASAPVHVYALEGTGPARTRLERSRARGFSRFVGRADEMATLELALHRATEGNGQVVGVVGEAGVGKSRLCLEFVERCRARGVAVHEAHCPSHGRTVPFLPVLELLRDLLGVSDRDAPLKARETITGRCLVLDRELEGFLPLVFDFLGVSDAAQSDLGLETEARERRLFAFVRRLVGALSAREPTLILVDDLHWIDAASDSFLAQLVEAVGGSRALLLVNFRPEYRPEWTQRSHYQQLPLAPLGPDAIAELLRALLGEHESLVGLDEQIERRTGGNPFFIEEVVQSLIESGALEGAPGAYRLVTPVERIEVPGTVQALLAARIDRLPEREKQVLHAAAVLGRSFSGPVLEQVTELPESELAGALAALQTAELVREQALYPRAEFAFRHPLTHQVAYESQLSARRTRVHAAAARALEAEHADRLDAHAALLAHHWEQAGEALEAARWHSRAALWVQRSKTEEALRHYRSCGELVEGLAPSPEVDALRLASRVGIVTNSADPTLGVTEAELEAAYREGRSLAERTGDLEQLARLLHLYAGALTVRLRAREAQPLLDEAVRIADRTGDRGLRVRTRSALTPLYYAGRVEELRLRSEEGLELAAGDSELEGYGIMSVLGALRCWHGLALCLLGRVRAGLEAIDRATELSRECDERALQGMSLLVGAAYSAWDPGRTLRAARELATIADAPLAEAMYRQVLAHAHLQREEWAEAIEILDRPYMVLQHSYLLALAYLGKGDAERALALARQQVAAYRAGGALVQEIVAQLTLAQVLRTIDAAGEREATEASLARAEELVRETGARFYLPQVHEQRGRLARALGQPEDADRELREAQRLYAEIGITHHAERLARELEA